MSSNTDTLTGNGAPAPVQLNDQNTPDAQRDVEHGQREADRVSKQMADWLSAERRKQEERPGGPPPADPLFPAPLYGEPGPRVPGHVENRDRMKRGA